MATGPTCIVAYTSEDGRFDSVRRAAAELARAAAARLILYDIDAAAGGLGELTNPLAGAPLPTGWSGEGSPEAFTDRLSAEDLDRAGRHAIARQVNEARRAGIDAFGWLPEKRGADELARYALREGADLIVLPTELAHPHLMQRLRGETAKRASKQSHVPIALVDRAGHVEYPEHDEQHAAEAESLDAAARDAGRRR